MRNCDEIHELLPLYAEDQLAPPDRRKVERHLESCAEAKKELEEVRNLMGALGQVPAPPIPPDLHARIMGKLGMAQAQPAKTGFPWGMPLWAMAAAAMVLIVLFIQMPQWKEQTRMGSAGGPQERGEDKAAAPAVPPPPTAAGEGFQKTSETLKNNASKVHLSYSPRTDNDAPIQRDKGKDLDLGQGQGILDAKNNKDFALPAPAAKQEEAPSAPFPSVLTSQAKKTRKTLPVLGALRSTSPAAAGAAMEPQTSPGLPPPSTPIPATNLSVRSLTYSQEETAAAWRGDNGPSADEKQELVTDRETFKQYWQMTHPGAEPPAVDFTKDAVVVLMGGSRPTAGYSLDVTRLEEKEDRTVIHYRLETPAPGAVTAQVFTSPWTLRVIPKPAKPAVFQKDP